MPAPKIILELVERFERNLASYKSGQYNETQLRREFLDPFFEALGWDVNNREGYAEAYKDVIHEDAVKIGGNTKAPDYSFRIGGTRKFFVEAKKPSIHIKEDPAPAFQVRRYAWSAKLPLSIVTDFEEFAVYDCRVKPDKADKTATARTVYLTYKQYAEKWDEIAAVFSRDAVLKGSFDKYAESHKAKKGTAEVDDAFLAEIENWRDLLARNIALRNPSLSTRELNFSVQRTIDRLIFLRICEDRGIEDYGALRSLVNGPNVYPRLRELYYKADARYNSGLFHFRNEKDVAEAPDNLTLGLAIDDKPLKEILRHLYYPDSPYEFSVLPADILGQVYEQFLGKVIRLTAGHHAVVEDKPEVKKAHGVYYTDTYIVDYIVKNTVGQLLEEKTPKQVEKVRILDPASGSGSFLLGAYQYLLDWHLKWYIKDGPEKYAKAKQQPIYQGHGGEWRLTTAERKRILLNNIYGVDIDSQAVEVTKLSLLLKVLEGETGESLNRQMSLFHERALPSLANNIKCGNSLVGPDFYEQQQMSFMDEEERYRVNVFDWEREFPEVFKAGGFDAVIGNPPYIRIQGLKEWAPEVVEFYKERYVSAGKGNYDIYVIFVEKGLGLLNNNGLQGYILPHKFFNAQYGEPLRKLIADGRHLREIVHFGHQQVFKRATTYTCLLFLSKKGEDELRFEKVDDLEAWRSAVGATGPITTEGRSTPPLPALHATIPANRVSDAEWNFVAGCGAEIFEKLAALPNKLGEIADIFVGLQTSADDVFIMNLVRENADTLVLKSKALGSECELEREFLFPLVSGTDVCRYCPLPERQYVLFPYEAQSGSVRLVPFDELKKRASSTAGFLARNRGKLEEREKGKFRDYQWHRFGRNQNIGIQHKVKLCVPRLVDRLYATYDETGTHFLDNVDVGGITLKTGYEDQGLPYLLGLLNSTLLRWYFPFVSAPFRGGWLSANRQFLSQLPIRSINLSDPTDKARHDRMVALVEQMLALHKQLANAKTANDKRIFPR